MELIISEEENPKHKQQHGYIKSKTLLVVLFICSPLQGYFAYTETISLILIFIYERAYSAAVSISHTESDAEKLSWTIKSS